MTATTWKEGTHLNPFPPNETTPVPEDEFLTPDDLNPLKRAAAERSLRNCLAEMGELIGEKKWADLVELFSPVENKLPELADLGLDAEPRAKLAFALGQLHRFDEAMRELNICINREPENFYFHSALAYTAYNSLWAAKNREILLAGKIRAERAELAHAAFQKAQVLRPDGITNFYREGMLYRKIQNQSKNAVPLFERAISNWDHLDQEQKKARHQEHKNFVKSLYQLAACLLDTGRPKRALPCIRRCLSEDEKTHHYSMVYKYFALGKVQFHLNAFSDAKDALLFALQCREGQPVDFVYELLARTFLAMDQTEKAMDAVTRVPEKRRRPYICWTQADILCARGDFQKAKRVLLAGQERDNRSKHKSLIRLAKIEYLLGDMTNSMRCAAEASRFFHEKWGGILDDGLFWQALGAYRMGDDVKALDLANELKAVNPRYPRLDKLLNRLEELSAGGGTNGIS